MSFIEKKISNQRSLFQVDWKQFSNVVLEKLRLLARKRRIDLKVFIAEKEELLPLKIKHLEYLLIELVDNALKFSTPNSEVVIFIQNARQYMIIRVNDFGLGMPFEIIPHIFNKFYQHEQDQQKRRGAGLGLSIVKGITRIYNGHIKIVTNPGTGTEIELRFNKNIVNNMFKNEPVLLQECHLN